jgi:hypothetical protein
MTKKKQGMTDCQIEEFVYSQIKRKEITFNDMISTTGAVDPDPDNTDTEIRDRLRPNRFSSLSEDTRMMELIADKDCSYLNDLPPLKIPLQDLFRFWWNRCIDKTLVVEMLLEDIFTYFREELRPPAEEPQQLDMAVDFEKLSYTETEKKAA